MAYEDLRTRLTGIQGVKEQRAKGRDQPTYWMGDEEIVRFINETTVDIRLTRVGIRDRQALLRGDERVRLRSNSGEDWLSVEIRESDDEDLVLELAKAAAQATADSPSDTSPDRPADTAE
jgi:hypothetical protein